LGTTPRPSVLSSYSVFVINLQEDVCGIRSDVED